jgi:hypothetical protein
MRWEDTIDWGFVLLLTLLLLIWGYALNYEG